MTAAWSASQMVAELTEQERTVAEVIAGRTFSLGAADAVLAEVAEIFGITPDDITGDSRKTRIVDARAVVAYALSHRGWTAVAISDVLNRDHSLISRSIQRLNSDFELRSLARQVA